MPASRILHLEDDESDALLIRRSLERAGLEIEVTVAANSLDYSAALERDNYDLVLSDNCIPGFGSIGALQAARAVNPEIPFICISGAWDDKTVSSLIAHGVTCCLLKSQSAQISAAVRQAIDLQQKRQEVARFPVQQAASDRLIKAVQDLSLARDVETIRTIVRHAARELTGADGATFVLRDGEQCHYVDEDTISPLWKGSRFPLKACISGWVMLNRTPVIIDDIYKDPRIPADAYRPTFVKSLLMVPIRSTAPIGAIGNYWATPHHATPREVELLQALANTAAVAMENVRIYAELEHRVHDRTAQLEVANRELETFSFSVSHDLRSPLNSIGAFAELLDDPVSPPSEDERREYIARIRQQTQRMGNLIEDFLRLAQVSRAELRRVPIDLVTLSKDVVAGLRVAQPDRAIEFVHPVSLAASADPTLIRAVLENLLANAWKYTSRRTSGTRVELGALSTNPRSPAIFYVRDNGAGFDPHYMDKLFTPFQRLHSPKDFPGSGVGLATVQRIIHKHGGRIWAEGRPNEGATFYFTLAQEPAA
ncbi:MAG: ATP-binding protein [Rariglobus sp.]